MAFRRPQHLAEAAAVMVLLLQAVAVRRCWGRQGFSISGG
jgi:hypothetical protein